MTVSPSRRWMSAMLTEAAKSETQMPWARGARRADMIARRQEAEAASEAPRARTA